MYGSLTTTKQGRCKVNYDLKNDSEESCICVFLTKIGYSGGNNHTGDRVPDWNDETKREFLDFPGTILASGLISQGDAGRMGSGDQLIAILHKNVVFRTMYSGRLYGAPSSHYYIFNGETIQSMTFDEREAADLW